MDRYFILNAQHEPVEVDLPTFCAFDKNIADTTVAENTRVWTVFLGTTIDRDPPEQPYFVHYVYEPGWQYRTVNTYGYHEAVARHSRIVEWLTKRTERRSHCAAATKAS
ncbi:hypothetical protein [Burkholderia pyrrocinia]